MALNVAKCAVAVYCDQNSSLYELLYTSLSRIAFAGGAVRAA